MKTDQVNIDDSVAGEKWIAIVVAAVLFTLVGGTIYLAVREDPNLSTCEDAIRAKLKAPATYKRVKFDGVGGADGIYDIEYDANNSFNTPLRGHGTCLLKGGKAQWMDFSDLPL